MKSPMVESSNPTFRVLVAEDEAIVAEGLRLQLEELGHEMVGWAKNGCQAVRMAETLSPDVAILDVMMPEMDGLAAASSIMESKPTPLLLLTAYSHESLVEQATQLGVMAYLLKPVTTPQLAVALRVAVGRFQEFAHLRLEVNGLRKALEVRQLVERAKAVLMRRLDIPEEEAWHRLRDESRRQQKPIGELATSVLAADRLL